MSVLMFGGNGGVGQELQQHMNGPVWPVSRKNGVDVTDINSVKRAINDHIPTMIVYLSVVNENSLLRKLDSESRDKQIAVSIMGYTNVVVAALEYYNEQRQSAKHIACPLSVVYISSVVAVNPVVGAGIYGASKAYGEALTRNAALESAKWPQMRFYNVRMGYFNAGIIQDVPAGVLEQIIQANPCKRLGKVQELAQLLDFLETGPKYMTGATIDISGGAA